MSKNESEWLGCAQVAAYLSVTTMTIWRWERDPRLAFPASTIIRGRKYWSRDDLDTWMRRMATSKSERDSESRVRITARSDKSR